MKTKITIVFILAATLLSAQTWYPINPSTGLKGLHGVSMLNSNHGIAVGNNGVILEYNGMEWSHMESPANESLRAVHFLNPNAAWAVGDNGVTLSYDGVSWTQVPGPSQANLVDVYFVDETHGWAVGAEIWRYDGTAWVVDAPWQLLHTVHFNDSNEGWTGGINKLYKHNGTEWLPYQELTGSGVDIIISALAITGPASGWLSGTSLGGSNMFYEYDGTTWTLVGTGAGPCYGLSFSGHDHGFGIINTVWTSYDPNVAVYKIVNGVWEKVFEPNIYGSFQLSSVEAVAPNEAWVTDILGFIYRGVDDDWSVSNGFATDTIHRITFPEPLIGHPASFAMAACGIDGIMRYENAEWTTEFTDQDFRFNQITSSFGFAAAYRMIPEYFPPWNYEARIYQYINGNWIMEDMGSNELYSPVSALFMLGPDNVWAASLSSLYHKTNGNWTALHFDMELRIKALHFNSESDGWLAGKIDNESITGVIYRLNGSNWESHFTTATGGINAFHVIDNNTIYAVGENGLIAFYNGNTWTEISPIVTKDLFTININIDNTGWAAGEDGVLLHFDGNGWSVQTSFTDASIFDICFPDPTLCVMVGAKGALFATQPQLPVGIKEPALSQNTLGILTFPNPAKDHITFAIENIENYHNIELRCFNLLGEQQYQTRVSPAGHPNTDGLKNPVGFEVGVSAWPTGMYIALVYSDGKPVGRGKFVVNR